MIVIDCKDCGKRHQPGVCEGKHRVLPKTKTKAGSVTSSTDTAPFDPKAQMTPGLEPKAAYNAYMRDYMRQKRGGLKRKPKETG